MKYLNILAVILICYSLFAAFYNNTIVKNEQSRGKNPKKMSNSILLWLIPVIFLAVTRFLTIIPAQECGVVITPSGVKQQTYHTGWHLILPWYTVQTMDKTEQVYTCAKRTSVNRSDPEYKSYKAEATQSETVWTPTIDGIKMGFDISASWRIDPEYAWWIYDNVSETDGKENGRFYWLEENVIKPKLKSALALTTSKYTPIQVYSTSREEIQSFVLERMKKDILSYHLILDQIDIREVYYNSDYETAINQKKLEEQKALTLSEVTKQKEELKKQAEIEKDIQILNAEGEAEALKIKGASVSSNPKIVQLEWINKWDGKLPEIMTGDGNGLLLNLEK
ncbi:MAG: prohibitin family protein [Bacteroidales bacterium]|jgi:regulator of protease activity HflC (stomatin/prohibitin superfamily)|nr:prohibitin family protein [Bacteroidales bacterium]